MQIAIGLTFPGELKDDAILCYLCKNFDMNINIIEASFSASRGWAILKVDADEEELDRAFIFLKEKGIKIQKIETIHEA